MPAPMVSATLSRRSEFRVGVRPPLSLFCGLSVSTFPTEARGFAGRRPERTSQFRNGHACEIFIERFRSFATLRSPPPNEAFRLDIGDSAPLATGHEHAHELLHCVRIVLIPALCGKIGDPLADHLFQGHSDGLDMAQRRARPTLSRSLIHNRRELAFRNLLVCHSKAISVSLRSPRDDTGPNRFLSESAAR